MKQWRWLIVPVALLLFVLLMIVGPPSVASQEGDGQPPPEPTEQPTPLPTEPPPEPTLAPAIDWARVQSPHMSEAAPARPETSPAEPADAPPPPPPLPPPAAPPAAPPSTGQTTYVVQRGDNLYRIALRFGVSLPALSAANNLTNPDRIYAGQQLVIPGASPTEAAPPSANNAPAESLVAPDAPSEPSRPAAQSPEPADGPDTYTVQRGDNLYEIARQFGSSVSTLVAANNIPNPNRLGVGQVLVIPGGSGSMESIPVAQVTVAAETAPPAPPSEASGTGAQSPNEVYTVRRGDSLYQIARRFGTTATALAAANNITDPNRVEAGRQLIIVPSTYTPAQGQPAAAESAAAPQTVESGQSPEAAQPAGTTLYTVQRGDKLYEIALRFSTTVDALVAANNIADPNRLGVGQQLIIVPSTYTPAETQPVSAVAPPPAPPAADAGSSGMFIWPVTSRRIVKYYSSGHPGIDIVDAVGVPVVAAAAGTVEFAGWNIYGYGYLIVIDHGNGVRTLYAHNNQLLVETGQVVEQGQLISLMGSTGRSNMPHVHLEIIFDYGRDNPCTLLPGGC